MQLKHIIADDEAVSPVIGVILMVAITVILAAVIGTFVLGLSDQADSTPTTAFDTTYEAGSPSGDTGLYQGSSGSADNGVDGGELTVTHTSGQPIDGGQLTLVDDDGGTVEAWSAGERVGAGSATTTTVAADDEVRLVWESDDGSTTDTLAVWTGPDA
jgi:flagellin-like protein